MLTISFYWRRFLTEISLKIWTTVAKLCKEKKNIWFVWSNIAHSITALAFFTAYNDRLNTFENKNVINSIKSWLKYSKKAEIIEWIIADMKNLLSTMSLFFKNYSLVEIMYLLIRFNKIKFFPWNTKNTDRNGINK